MSSPEETHPASDPEGAVFPDAGAALDEAPIGILHADAEGRVAAWNPAAEAALHRSPLALGAPDWTVVIDPEDRPLVCAARQQALDEGRAMTDARAVAPDGSVLRLRITITRAAHGGHRAFLESLDAESTLREERDAALDETSRIIREESALLALIAHELHEPLRKISSFGEVLRESAAGGIDPAGADALDRIQRATGRMRLLLEGLVALGRVATGALALVPVDLREVLESVMETLGPELAEAGATVEISPLPEVVADAFRMEQLFAHLIRNALASMREGASRVVRVAPAVDEGGGCGVTVSDEGEGFDEVEAERIFEAFHRVHGRSHHGGVGLGLTICRRIVERHGGRIHARGVPGEGATFTVLLPRARPVP